MDELLIALVVWLGKLIARAYRSLRDWWRRRGERPGAHGARIPSAERLGSSHMPDDPAASQLKRMREGLTSLTGEASTLASTLGRSPLSRPLAQAIDRGVVARCGELSRELDSLSVGSQLAVELERIASRSASLRQLLANLAWMAKQREHPSYAASLAAADRIAGACHKVLGSILDGGRGGAASKAFCFLAPGQPVDLRGFSDAGLLPVGVQSPFPDRLPGWASVASGSGRGFLESVDGLKWELRSRLGLPDRYPVPFAPRGFLSSEEVLLPFGPWLETLFGDLVGSLLLGPAYAMALGKLLASPQSPNAIAAVGVSEDGSLYSREPPAQVRMAVSVAAMDDHGEDDLRERLWGDWNELHGWPATMYLPTRMAGWIEAPMSAFTEMAEKVADLMLFEPMSSLGHHSLDEIPALAHPRVQAEVSRVRDLALAGRDGSSTDSRLLLAGTLAAAWAAPNREAELLRWMRSTLEPREVVHARGTDAYARGRDAYARGRDAYARGGDAYAQGGDAYARGGDAYVRGGDVHARGGGAYAQRGDAYACDAGPRAMADGRERGSGEPCRDDIVTALRDAVVLDAMLTRFKPGGGRWARR